MEDWIKSVSNNLTKSVEFTLGHTKVKSIKMSNCKFIHIYFEGTTIKKVEYDK